MAEVAPTAAEIVTEAVSTADDVVGEAAPTAAEVVAEDTSTVDEIAADVASAAAEVVAEAASTAETPRPFCAPYLESLLWCDGRPSRLPRLRSNARVAPTQRRPGEDGSGASLAKS